MLKHIISEAKFLVLPTHGARKVALGWGVGERQPVGKIVALVALGGQKQLAWSSIEMKNGV